MKNGGYSMDSKYGNIPTWWNKVTGQFTFSNPGSDDYLRFDSKFECKTYLTIRKHFPAEWVHLKPKLTLKAKSRYSAAVKYVPDFLVSNPNSPLPLGAINLGKEYSPFCFVEAKGYMTSAAKLKLQLMEDILPVHRRHLLLVSDTSIAYFGRSYQSSISLTTLEIELQQLKTTIKIVEQKK